MHLVQARVDASIRAEADEVHGARLKAGLDVLEAITGKERAGLEGDVHQRCTCSEPGH